MVTPRQYVAQWRDGGRADATFARKHPDRAAALWAGAAGQRLAVPAAVAAHRRDPGARRRAGRPRRAADPPCSRAASRAADDAHVQARAGHRVLARGPAGRRDGSRQARRRARVPCDRRGGRPGARTLLRHAQALGPAARAAPTGGRLLHRRRPPPRARPRRTGAPAASSARDVRRLLHGSCVRGRPDPPQARGPRRRVRRQWRGRRHEQLGRPPRAHLAGPARRRRPAIAARERGGNRGTLPHASGASPHGRRTASGRDPQGSWTTSKRSACRGHGPSRIRTASTTPACARRRRARGSRWPSPSRQGACTAAPTCSPSPDRGPTRRHAPHRAAAHARTRGAEARAAQGRGGPCPRRAARASARTAVTASPLAVSGAASIRPSSRGSLRAVTASSRPVYATA